MSTRELFLRICHGVMASRSFHVHVVPALRRLLERTELRPLERATAAVDWRCPPGRRQYLPALVDETGGPLPLVRPSAAGGSGSHLVASLAAAQALAVVPAEGDAVTAGDEVGLLRC